MAVQLESSVEHTLENGRWLDSFDKFMEQRFELRERNIIKKNVRHSFNVDSSIENNSEDKSNILFVEPPHPLSKKVTKKPLKKNVTCTRKIPRLDKKSTKATSNRCSVLKNPFICPLSPICDWNLEYFPNNLNNISESKLFQATPINSNERNIIDYQSDQENSNKSVVLLKGRSKSTKIVDKQSLRRTAFDNLTSSARKKTDKSINISQIIPTVNILDADGNQLEVNSINTNEAFNDGNVNKENMRDFFYKKLFEITPQVQISKKSLPVQRMNDSVAENYVKPRGKRAKSLKTLNNNHKNFLEIEKNPSIVEVGDSIITAKEKSCNSNVDVSLLNPRNLFNTTKQKRRLTRSFNYSKQKIQKKSLPVKNKKSKKNKRAVKSHMPTRSPRRRTNLSRNNIVNRIETEEIDENYTDINALELMDVSLKQVSNKVYQKDNFTARINEEVIRSEHKSLTPQFEANIGNDHNSQHSNHDNIIASNSTEIHQNSNQRKLKRNTKSMRQASLNKWNDELQHQTQIVEIIEDNINDEINDSVNIIEVIVPSKNNRKNSKPRITNNTELHKKAAELKRSEKVSKNKNSSLEIIEPEQIVHTGNSVPANDSNSKQISQTKRSTRHIAFVDLVNDSETENNKLKTNEFETKKRKARSTLRKQTEFEQPRKKSKTNSLELNAEKMTKRKTRSTKQVNFNEITANETLWERLSQKHIMPSNNTVRTSNETMMVTLQPGKWRKSLHYLRRTNQTCHRLGNLSTIVRNQNELLQKSVEYMSTSFLAGTRKSIYIKTEYRTESMGKISNAPIDWRHRVLNCCGQKDLLPFEDVFSSHNIKKCRKIGEGVYGEVFMYTSRASGNSDSVLKIIPIEGAESVNGEVQKTFEQIYPEIVISKDLHSLHNDDHGRSNVTSGFVDMKKVHCIQGSYPKHLIKLWEAYDNEKGSDNDHPDVFINTQLYIVLELEFAGKDMESFVFKNAEQSYYMLKQIVLTLAIGEATFQFEHRDLHWGNILLTKTTDSKLNYKLDNKVLTIPTKGVKATIIDYTLSRMTTAEGYCYYNDLSNDEELFSATGDYQFDIYRMMRDVVQNDWNVFEPKTNVYWISYVISKLRDGVAYKSAHTKLHAMYMKKLDNLSAKVLDFESAVSCARYFFN